MRYSFGRGRPELQCEKIKRNGERCRAVRATGSRLCCRHGGGPAAKAARAVWLQWRANCRALYQAGFQDDLAGVVPVAGRVMLGEAWQAAQEHGDPRTYQAMRRTVAARYRSRIMAVGRADILAELGIE